MGYNNPFIKVTWEDSPENFTAEKINRVKTYFQQKYKTKSVQIVTKNLGDVNNTKLKSLEASDNILDSNYQKILMKDFIKENKINIDWSLIDRLDNRINEKLDKQKGNRIRYNKWYIKRIEFSNFLSFGEKNIIDFTDLEGITVIESTPRNFGGKSTSTVDLLMFLFFNSTTKTKTNSEIFNRFTNKDEVYVKGEITIDGEDYFIERTITRKKGKQGDFNVTNKLEFYKKTEDGVVKNLTGEQRRETETFIASAIGTEEDFLSTILTTGYNLEQLIESKPTARGQILTKFIGLESLKLKEETCKELFNEYSRTLVSNTHNIKQLETDIDTIANQTESIEKDIIKLQNNLNDYHVNLKALEARRDEILGKRNNNIDQDLIKTNPTVLKKEIEELLLLKDKALKNASTIDVKEPSKYYLEDEHEKLKKKINNIIVELSLNEKSKANQEKLLKELETGTICPTCKRKLDDVDHTDEIEKLRLEIKKLIEGMNKLKSQSEKYSDDEREMKKIKYEFDTYEKNKLLKAKYELESEQKQLEINSKQAKLDNYESNKKKLEDNKKIDLEIVTLRSQIETANADINTTNIQIERNKNNIKNLLEKKTVNSDLIKKIKQEEQYLQTFKIYLTIYGKNGISKVILKNMIPLLNRELYRLLVDSCHFILELNINDKNEVDFIMIDTESRIAKPLNSGSGYERTISSLALRSVLTKISSLPKPNIVVMDEVFGKVADENLELVGEFFKKIKLYFEHIFVISHNPLIRNWSNNLIMIKKEDNISAIDFITTKIS